MVSNAAIGWALPAAAGAIVTAAAFVFSGLPSVEWGVTAGQSVAVAQSYLSTASLAWAWNKKFFWWVWGGGFLARLLIFAATAYVVHVHTDLSLVATMTSMVVSTTVFLAVESAVCLKG